MVTPPNLECQVVSTVEGAATPSLSKNSGDHFEMVVEENLQYPDPDDDFENFETDILINSPTCITLSSSSAYTKHRSRITVPVRKLKRPNSVFSEYIEQDKVSTTVRSLLVLL